MSLRLTPAPGYATQTTPQPSAPSAPGVHDTLRARLNQLPPSTSSHASTSTPSSHPLETRLSAWRATQDALKMNLLRREFGIAEPVKRGMEMRICGAGEWRPAVLGRGAGVHSDILAGRDAEVGWEDVFVTREEVEEQRGFHVEVEGRVGMAAW